MPITGRILDLAAAHPEQIAIATPDRAISYRELACESRSTFAAVRVILTAQSTPPQPAPEAHGLPIVGVSLESAFDSARLFAELAGYPVVCATIDPRWPRSHQVRIIVTTGMGLVISDDADLAAALADAGWTGTVVTGADFAARTSATDPAEMPSRRPGDEPFLMLFSSGTTDNPKAFMKTRYQYRENYAVSSAYLEPLPGVATLAPGPLSYSLTLYALVECLASGGQAHLADRVDPVAIGTQIRENAITRVVAVPAIVQGIVAAASRRPEDFDSLELIITGGANLPAAIRDGVAEALPGVRLISYYGAAEIGFIGDSRSGDGTVISLYTGIEASICDPAGQQLADGELGTLWIRARACSDGYVTGTANVALRGADGWATVHDQARMLPRAQRGPAQITLAGRAGDIVVTGGHKVALPEVERAFEGAPGLGDVCAISVPSDSLGSLVALVIEAGSVDGSDVVGDEAGSALKTRLRDWAQPRLAPQFVPWRWYLVEALPRTVGGKIRRDETARLIEQHEAGGAAAGDLAGGVRRL